MVEKIWKKNCPECGTKLSYSSKMGLAYSVKIHSLCKKCSKLGKRNPYFGKVCFWKGRVGPNKGKKFGADFKLKMSKIVKGRKHTKRSKIKMSLSNIGKNTWSKGRVVSDNTKQKLRLKRIEDLRKKGIFPGSKFSKNYNPNACKYFDKINEKHGWSLQHALNGGEITVCGYYLDGYDKQRNIVMEYDEEYHKNQKEKDLKRQKIIIEELKPNSFFRYDEKQKILYDIIVRKEG